MAHVSIRFPLDGDPQIDVMPHGKAPHEKWIAEAPKTIDIDRRAGGLALDRRFDDEAGYPSELEVDISMQHGGKLGETEQEASKALEKLARKSSDLVGSISEDDLESVKAKLQGDLADFEAGVAEKVRPTIDRRFRFADQFRLFRHNENITADYQVEPSDLWVVATFVLSIVVEAVLTTPLFAASDKMGQLGGLGVASLFGSGNGVLGMMFGILVLMARRKGGISATINAGVGMVFGALITLGFLLVVAHWRLAVQLHPHDAYNQARSSLLHHMAAPFSDARMYAYGILNVFFICLTGAKTVQARGYPGYRKFRMNVDRAMADEAKLRQTLGNGPIGIGNDARDVADELIDAAGEEAASAGTHLTCARAVVTSFGTAAEDLVGSELRCQYRVRDGYMKTSRVLPQRFLTAPQRMTAPTIELEPGFERAEATLTERFKALKSARSGFLDEANRLVAASCERVRKTIDRVEEEVRGGQPPPHSPVPLNRVRMSLAGGANEQAA